MVQVLQDVRPDFVFTPFIGDVHPDHVAVNAILMRALEDPPVPRTASIVGRDTLRRCGRGLFDLFLFLLWLVPFSAKKTVKHTAEISADEPIH